MMPYEAFACLCGAEDVVLRDSYKPKTRGKLYYACSRSKKEERVLLLAGSPAASTTPIYSSGSSSTLIYSSGSSSTPISSSGSSRNAECSNCKHLLDIITVLEATVDMYMHPEQHTVNSAALFHEVYNNMGKLDLNELLFSEAECNSGLNDIHGFSLEMAEEDALLAFQHECCAKSMAEDASSKKFFVSNFTNYKMTYSRPVFEQYNEILGTMITRVNVNIMITQRLILTRRLNLLVENVAKLVTLKGIAKVYYVTYVSKAYFVHDDDVAWDVILDENRFSSVLRPSLRIPNGTEDIGGSVVPEEGFKQKSNIDYFDTYAPVARISTIRLLIAMTSIHNLIIHQMYVKTSFLNEELEEEVYMNQPQGFIMPGNENKVCKLIKSLYELKQAPKQWHQKFNKVVLSNGSLLNQANNVYIANLMKLEFLSSKFSMKDMGEVNVILGIRIKHKSNRIAISQSHYIEKAVSQLDYSKVIGYLMYAMTCTRPDIAFAIGKLIRLMYNGYPLVLEGYTDTSWISNTEDNSSTSGWVFLLGGGAISWASKKQTCITGSTIESEFMALAAAGKEAEWLKNLLPEIPLWSKPIATISIRHNSAATLANAYS
nr:zinc finger, CCHC-type [Tanacetum cinerariifolium]